MLSEDTKPSSGGRPKSLSANLETLTKNDLNDEVNESRMTKVNLQNATQKEKGQGSEKTHWKVEREIPKRTADFEKEKM